ncbi:hypothetical protein BGZ89_011109 [Linnemannia elongata]|nr:hypothetical protein BGZ89_011109 [Linnemannia elongata]
MPRATNSFQFSMSPSPTQESDRFLYPTAHILWRSFSKTALTPYGLSRTLEHVRGSAPHTRGLLIASTSLAELRLEFIRMPVMDLIDVLASKRFLRTVNIRTRRIFKQGLLAHQELRELHLERILDMFDGSLPVKTLVVASSLSAWFFRLFLPVMTNLQSIDISQTQGNNGTLVAELLAKRVDNLRTVKISSNSFNWMM